LGKNYGRQFKKFLLDNFSIKYVVKSNAEHWFKNSQVSTIFITLERGKSDKPTRFVTLNFKLNDKLGEKTVENLQFIEDLYTQIDNCDNPDQDWQQDEQYKTVFSNSDDTVKVSLVSRQKLIQSLGNKENWATYFISENPLSIFENNLISPHSSIFTNGRGTRTGQDKMHILTTKDIEKLKIEKDFLQPVLQSSRHVSGILHNKVPDTYLFICDKPETELQKKYPNTYKWIKKWETENNKIGVLLPKVFENRKPFWYTLKAEQPANIFISINPDKKLFFSYSPNPIHLNQRLVAIRAKTENAPIITALLNSVVSLLIVELNGVSRNLGALDLNADFFKSKMRMLNPALLSRKDKNDILTKFVPLSIRVIEQYDTEFKKKDRVEFDTAILKAYGYKPSILPRLYELLIDTIENRVEMKNR
jgi:hypothetical protein